MLLKIYFKEMKDCFRDRRTLLLTVLLPIIMMSGLTYFYEKIISGGEGETYRLAVDESLTQTEKNILTSVETIELVPTSNPVESVEEGEALAALTFSSNFVERVQAGDVASVMITGDSFSQKSNNLMSLVKTALANYEKVITSERLQAQGTDLSIIEPFTISQAEISAEDPNVNLVAMLIPLVLAIALGIGASPGASDLFAGEKEKKTMEALLMTPVKRSTLVLSKWMTISSLGVITGLITLLVVSLEIGLFTEHLKKAISLDENASLIIGIALFITIIYAMFNASILMITSIIAKTIKESQSYSSPIMMIAAFPVMITSSIGINEFTFQHFAIPILNIYSLLKELIFGIVDYEHVFITVGSNVLCIIVLFIVGRVLFMKDKWVMS
ncbi:ABC transporter permease subunit [Bacillus spongiae]|uniref:ABC transporter permease subunit n=1 Tax=Bacillus spongiae TaxID=2683610 RepID=A0ABU8HDJ5_9BACI